MLGPIVHSLRILRTGLCFAVFGVGALVLAHVVVPAQRLGHPRSGWELCAQRSVHRGARFFVWVIRRLGVVELETTDAARLRLREPAVVVANHPTLFDMVILAALMPQADCVVSSAWARNPFLRRLVVDAGYVRNDGGPALVKGCLARLRAGRTVVVFPEGTRSPAGGIGGFRPGAAHIALRSGREILPVLLTCEPSTLTKGRRWYDVPPDRLHFQVRVGEPLSPDGGAEPGAPLAGAARRLTAELHELFRKGLDIADVARA